MAELTVSVAKAIAEGQGATAWEIYQLARAFLHEHGMESPPYVEHAALSHAAGQDGEQCRAASGWRCFHCDEVFTDEESATIHFGTHERHDPACTIDANEYRRMEKLSERFAEEDADCHRAMYRMQSEHQQALRRAEEAGYAKGVRDAEAKLCALSRGVPEGDMAKEKQGDRESYSYHVQNEELARHVFREETRSIVEEQAAIAAQQPILGVTGGTDEGWGS